MTKEKLLSDKFLAKYKQKQPDWGFNNLGYIVYKRTYARLKPDGTTEEWWETVERCVEGAQKIGAQYTKEEAERLYDHVFNLKCNFAGRMLWQLGTPLVDKFQGNSLLNCWNVSVNEPKAFLFIFENLMLGGGLGFSIRREDVHELPRIKPGVVITHEASKDADFIVPDSRQGWIKLLAHVLDAFYVTGKSFSYSTVLVRGAGEQIKGFGGTASGPKILIEGIEKITKIFQSREEKKLRSIDALDICNVIGSIVVAGNVRRSAQIALGDPDDYHFLRAKNWSLGNVPNWRAMSNNTIYADSYEHISRELWENGYEIDPNTGFAKGEPYGFFNLPLTQKFGRIKDGPSKDSKLYPQAKDNATGTNPCVTADTWVHTSNGARQVKDLIGQDFLAVHNGSIYPTTSKGFWHTGTKRVLKLKTRRGFELTLTPNHRLLREFGGERAWTEVGSLDKGDSIVLQRHDHYSWGDTGQSEIGWLLGNLVGDGTFTDDRAILTYWGENKREMLTYAGNLVKTYIGARKDLGTAEHDSHDRMCLGSAGLKELANRYGIYQNAKYDLSTVELASSSFYEGFLRGLFDADGSIQGSQAKGVSVRLTSISLPLLGSCQRMLARLGILSTIYEDRASQGMRSLPDGHGGMKDYLCQATHELVIGRDSVLRYAERIGFEDPIKQTRLIETIAGYKRTPYRDSFFDEIISVEDAGEQDVYDVTVEEAHAFDANGFVAHNCGEISLASYECCNLSELYLNRITSKEELIDCAKLIYKTQKAISALNFIHDETNDIVHKNMRLGLGVTGVCQALDKLDWLDECYQELRKFDKEWSKQRGWPRSIKLTTVKPSGCSRKDSLVLTSDGLLRLDEIGDISGPQWQTVSKLKSSSDDITKFYVNGKVKTRILRTADGFEYESSLNHRYWIDGAWKYVEDIKVGDSMTARLGGYDKRNEPSFKRLVQERVTNSTIILQPEKMNADLAFFIGLFYADGSVHDKGIRISFNRRDNDLIVLLKSIVRENFGLESSIDDDHGLYINSVFLKTWLKEQGILKDYCDRLVVPAIIRRSSTDSIKAFIAGFWRGDGGQHNLSNWSLCSVSRPFALEVATLMRAVGYNPSITNAGPGGYGKIDRWILINRSSTPSRYQATEYKNRFLENGQWADPIVEIVESECETFDIEVADSHQYILNGAVSHNTLSLLAGATPGVHPAYSQYYIRRVRMGSGDKLVSLCRNSGYKVEYVKNFDGSENHDTVVVEFPCETPVGSILAKDMDVIKQLEMVARLQSEWSDNAVSVTAYYDPAELSTLKAWLKDNYETKIKSVSFLLRDKHGFLQAPYEEISEETYRELSAKVKPIKIDNADGLISDLAECASGACPIR